MQIQIRWADIDQNRHLRHSVYYDYGAMARMEFLSSRGLTTSKLEELKIGPILFREECVFRREIKLEDIITLDIELVRAKHDFTRWSLMHNFHKEDGAIAAKISVDGAWMDIEKRKLTVPPAFVQEIFAQFPHSENFEWIGD